jgi:hypothetical protein
MMQATKQLIDFAKFISLSVLAQVGSAEAENHAGYQSGSEQGDER